MEYKKNNMYQMADQYKKNGWRRVDIANDFNYEQTAELPSAATEVEVPQLEVDRTVEERAVEMLSEEPGEMECGYCITPAMSYTPMQKWNSTYEPEIGFTRGTIFPELDLPFLGEEACEE